ncbi:hypothetical protein [Adhaeribacter pallidiroseus]|uniref:Uncharacterized protein n=1 Tax=Adhaeribacter pallidiroseus TaxID=2072847 RepID=A0A369QLP6_9BACT|nr:hypothetical protein [Adhaeribacter pallidiroseus]RDC64146.1 hypothetical protein AHMF7616_02757 [Adhaeribacter pallidiroseus]
MAEYQLIYFGLAFLTSFNILLGMISLNFFLKSKQAKEQQELDKGY